MRPLTEDQLSMLLSEVEVNGPATSADLDLTEEQVDAIKTWTPTPLRRWPVDVMLDQLRNVGLVPCGFCFGTGEVCGAAWTMTDVYWRRFICIHCDGTGRAR